MFGTGTSQITVTSGSRGATVNTVAFTSAGSVTVPTGQSVTSPTVNVDTINPDATTNVVITTASGSINLNGAIVNASGSIDVPASQAVRSDYYEASAAGRNISMFGTGTSQITVTSGSLGAAVNTVAFTTAGSVTIPPAQSLTVTTVQSATAQTLSLVGATAVVLIGNNQQLQVCQIANAADDSCSLLNLASQVTATAAVASTSTGTGTIVVTGGAGFSGSVYAANVHITANDITQITSITTTVIANGCAGTITTFNAVTLALSSSTFQVTNAEATTTSNIQLTIVSYSGTLFTNGIPYVMVGTRSAGSFTVVILNVGATQALNGVLKISFLVS